MCSAVIQFTKYVLTGAVIIIYEYIGIQFDSLRYCTYLKLVSSAGSIYTIWNRSNPNIHP